MESGGMKASVLLVADGSGRSDVVYVCCWSRVRAETVACSHCWSRVRAECCHCQTGRRKFRLTLFQLEVSDRNVSGYIAPELHQNG